MSDLAKYVRARAVHDPEFAEGLEAGYADFKIGALLRQAREKAGLTQEDVADRLETKKLRSAESRIAPAAFGSLRWSAMLKRSGGNSLWSFGLPGKASEPRR